MLSSYLPRNLEDVNEEVIISGKGIGNVVKSILDELKDINDLHEEYESKR